MSIEQIERMQSMRLHTTIKICDGVHAMRVPSGWIYFDEESNSSCFVPEPVRKHSIEITDEERKVLKGLFV